MSSNRSIDLFGQQSKPIRTYGRWASKRMTRDKDLADVTSQSKDSAVLSNTPMSRPSRMYARKLFRSLSNPVQHSSSDLPSPEHAEQVVGRDCDVDLDAEVDLLPETAGIPHYDDPNHDRTLPDAVQLPRRIKVERANRHSHDQVDDFPTSPVAVTPLNKSSKVANKLQSSCSSGRVQQSSVNPENSEAKDESEVGLKTTPMVIQTPQTSNIDRGPPLPQRRGLIFNKTPLRGYKQIRYPTDASIHSFSSTYPTGDGFSLAEAPAGRGSWGKKRKQLCSTPGVGVLDLHQEQTDGQSQPQKYQRRNLAEAASSPRLPASMVEKEMPQEPDKIFLKPGHRNSVSQLRDRSTPMNGDRGKTLGEEHGANSQEHTESPEKIGAGLRTEKMPTDRAKGFQSKMDEVTSSQTSERHDADGRIFMTSVLASGLAGNQKRGHHQPELEESRDKSSDDSHRFCREAVSNKRSLQGDVLPEDADSAGGRTSRPAAISRPAVISQLEECAPTEEGISMVEVFTQDGDTCPMNLNGQGQSDSNGVGPLSRDAVNDEINLVPGGNGETKQRNRDQETFIFEPAVVGRT